MADIANAEQLNYGELLTIADVTKVLQSHKGPSVKLGTYSHEHLVQGDHYCSTVLRLKVDYTADVEVESITYIVKLFSITNSPLLLRVFKELFKMEIHFYTEILPSLNNQLKKLGFPPLKTPICHHTVVRENHSILYFEDMCQDGFQAHDTRKPFDEHHVKLVVKELARFHAASRLLFDSEEITPATIGEKYPMLNSHMDNLVSILKEYDICMLKACLETGRKICEGIPQYKHVEEYMAKLKNAEEKYNAAVKPSDTFFVIRHGDLKSNNALFKYDAEGNPIEVALIDFQLSGIGSNVLDLIHFIFPGMESKKREKSTARLLDVYENTYKAICAQKNLITFSKEDLVVEYDSKMFFALIMAICLIPLTTFDETVDVNFIKLFTPGPVRDAELVKFNEAAAKCLRRHCMFRPRFLDLLDYLDGKHLFKLD